MLYVRKEYCGRKGVGTKLLNLILSQTKNNGYTELLVRSAAKFMESGWGFYDRKGFVRIGMLTSPVSEKISQIWIMKI
jgi:ribosomal protein S18 acetylase RimI-like enzyme